LHTCCVSKGSVSPTEHAYNVLDSKLTDVHDNLPLRYLASQAQPLSNLCRVLSSACQMVWRVCCQKHTEAYTHMHNYVKTQETSKHQLAKQGGPSQ
jgi:hypothetical protein